MADKQRAYYVTVPGYEKSGPAMVFASSPREARLKLWRKISDVLPVKYIELRARLAPGQPRGEQVIENE